MSVSAFNQYLRCPLGFLYEYVLRVPSIESEAAVYGTSVHQVLERTFRKMQEDPNQQWPEINWLVGQFERELNRRRGFLSKESYQYRLDMGREQLPLYYAQRQKEWVKESRQEVRVLHAEVEGVPLKGVIDKIEFLQPQAVRVVDYKTGKTDPKKVRRPNRGSSGGDYWRQLVFYQLLLAHSNYQHLELLGGRIDYVDRDIETGSFAMEDADIHSGDRKWLTERIVQVYAGIQNQDFYEGCGKPSCVWCQFANVVHPSESLVNEEREALDDPL
ncbi:MAG: PD-(D/E)XK nuclease family protein [Bacteroidota bacterium]